MCGGAKPLERTTTNGARLIFALVMATSPSFVVHQSAAAENNQGAQLAAMCASCHRLDGRDQGIPSIVGLDQQKFTDLMEAFRSGTRPARGEKPTQGASRRHRRRNRRGDGRQIFGNDGRNHRGDAGRAQTALYDLLFQQSLSRRDALFRITHAWL